ncbi:glycoside hydrolase family 71/99-like protein [Crateriforma spongiae]|uniref:glycoside hydrolase family 71/99-like protein n=1 Tax=Crateriforma spongiae TaxID=2724528 RepID=UPI00144549A2|nr:glycoside hydrolase family 71/99-like protein [Crateriforma spongiae]
MQRLNHFNQRNRIPLTVWLCLFVGLSAVSHADSPGPGSVDCTTLDGKVMCGYQGWFNCPGDGSELGWRHWGRSSRRMFGPESVTIDLWPDVSEFDDGELFETGFRNADGSIAKVFSSANQATVDRHFRWMKDYGIDGAFVQRFATSLRSDASRSNRDRILNHCRQAAENHGRAFVVMYDLSGLREGQLGMIADDWDRLDSAFALVQSPAYLHHRGKPLVAIWGVGFKDRHRDGGYTLQGCRDMVAQIKAAGCSVMLGVPTGWRQQTRDCVDDPMVQEILQMADVISPWTPGRYRDLDQVRRHADDFWAADQRRCDELGQDYLPVIFPGFSWHNLKEGQAELGAIPRQKGKFLWSQVVAAKQAGANMLYVAMFDEVDEGTAIFKCTNDPPVDDHVPFLTYEGLPSDHYLRLVGEAARVIRGEKPVTEVPNVRP